MASLIRDKNRQGEFNGCRTIQFIDANRNRKSIRLGKVTAKAGETIKARQDSNNLPKRGGSGTSPKCASTGVSKSDDGLSIIVEAWPTLPEANRASILAIVQSGQQ